MQDCHHLVGDVAQQARLKRLIENGELPEYATVIPPHLDVGDAAAAAPAP